MNNSAYTTWGARADERCSQCDGEEPVCTPCRLFHHTPCEYDIDGDRRRNSSLKRQVTDLKTKKKNLQYILDSIKTGSKSDCDAVVNILRSDQTEDFDSISKTIRRLKGPDFGLDFPETPLSASLLWPHRRIGPSISVERAQPPLLQFGSWTRVTNDAVLAKHLLDLYFTWSHPFYVLFSEELFRYSLADMKLKYASPLLVNAILAVGCHYSSLSASRATPSDSSTSGDHFFAEAKRLLREENEPAMTTVAALGVMSIRQSMKGDTNSGLEYARQMISASAAMCLHMDPTSLDSFKQMSTPEIEARRVTFWGTYAVETTSAMCLGRISGLSTLAVRIEKPFPNRLDSRVWKPHGHQLYDSPWAEVEQSSYTYSLARQLGYLTEIVNDASHLLYTPRESHAIQKLRHIYERYEEWYQNLPGFLCIKDNRRKTLPHVISLQ